MNVKLYERIAESLEILVDFFNADNKGLTTEELSVDLYTVSSDSECTYSLFLNLDCRSKCASRCLGKVLLIV